MRALAGEQRSVIEAYLARDPRAAVPRGCSARHACNGCSSEQSQPPPTAPVTVHLAYSYDNAKRRTALTLPDGKSQNWGYDAAGQLSSASYPDGSSEADQYDAGGNRTVITGAITLTGTNVITNTYDLADELIGTASTRSNYYGNGKL